MEFKEVQELAKELVERDEKNERDKLFKYMDRMDELDYDLPLELSEISGVHKMTSTDPFDALKDSVDLFAAYLPKPNIAPLGPGLKTDKLERALKWKLYQAFRRKGRQWKQVIKDSFKYDMISNIVVYLPNQISAMALMNTGLSEKRLQDRYMERYGEFAVVRRNPQEVHPLWSDFLLEGVLHKSVMPVHKAISFWGEGNIKKVQYLEKKFTAKETMNYIAIYDWTDFDQRTVWGILQEDNKEIIDPLGIGDMRGEIIYEENNDLDFIPWVVRAGSDEELQPLLYPLFKTGNWETQSAMETLLVTEVFKLASAVEDVIEGPNPETAMTEDYDSLGTRGYLKAGHKYDRIQKPQFDTNLTFISDWIKQKTSKSTLPSIIQQGDAPGGLAFASLEQLVSLGIKRLNDYKETSEEAFTEMYYQMIYWMKKENKEFVVYEKDPISGQGRQLEISNSDLDIKNINLTVSLDPDLPEDMAQKLNVALMIQQLGGSTNYAKNIAGIEDPEDDTNQRHSEEIKEQIHANRRLLLETAGAAQAQKVMQSIVPPPPEEGVSPAPTDNTPAQPALFNMGGDGNNPALGGTPPVSGAPQTIAGANNA